MRENNKHYMEGIISIDETTKWFDEDLNFSKKYRTSISGNEKFTSEFINDKDFNYRKEYYNSKFEKSFDSDSSPIAWEHYIRHYDPSTFGTIKDKLLNKTPKYLLEGLKYDDNYEKCVARLYAAPKEYAVKLGTKTKNGCKEAEGFLGGDSDFNFNEDKYPRLVKYLLGLSPKDKVNYKDVFKKQETKEIKLLVNCNKMHHTLLNFSLMQATGGLNNIKQTKFEDRLDAFFRFLNTYFVTKQENRFEMLKNAGPVKRDENITVLIDNLNQFGCIYNYCAKIYFLPTYGYPTGKMLENGLNITNENKDNYADWQTLLDNNTVLINALIESGKQDIASSDRVVEYMRLAVQFWKAKEDYFQLMDEILEAEKNK